jgi:hypothetical protein
VQDNGTKFHYSWLIILIDLVGRKEPNFLAFLDRKGKCYAARYESLWHAKDNKMQQENNTVFAMLLEELQQRIANVWRMPMEVVQDRKGILRFKAPHMDPGRKGSKEGMVINVILHHQGRGGLDS